LGHTPPTALLSDFFIYSEKKKTLPGGRQRERVSAGPKREPKPNLEVTWCVAHHAQGEFYNTTTCFDKIRKQYDKNCSGIHTTNLVPFSCVSQASHLVKTMLMAFSDLSLGDGFSGAIAIKTWWTDANREIKPRPLDPSNSTEFWRDMRL